MRQLPNPNPGGASPPLLFDRHPARHNPRLITSTCRLCLADVGTAADPLLLRILEDAHNCPLQPTQFSKLSRR